MTEIDQIKKKLKKISSKPNLFTLTPSY